MAPNWNRSWSRSRPRPGWSSTWPSAPSTPTCIRSSTRSQLLPAAFRGHLTRGLLLKFAAYAGVVAALGWLRRTYGFSFGLDFVYFAMNGLLPLIWLTGSPPCGLRCQGWRLLVVLPGAILAGLVGTVLTNGLP